MENWEWGIGLKRVSFRLVASPLPAHPRMTRCKYVFVRATNRSHLAASQLYCAVSEPILGPLAAWTRPSNPHGWVHGVSGKR
ncbi:hypothetical protein ABZP12_01345 [Xanthomonas euvesicatoria]